jgi:predicted nucleotidyltransferase
MATAFPELNAVLGKLVSDAKAVLGDNFVGAYLQGSFAVGDADEHSDVDFLVVTRRALSETEQEGLGRLHERLFALETPWAQHLEGSYVPAKQLRRIDPARAPWFYFDNGAREPIWDGHDNSAVVRWSLYAAQAARGFAGTRPAAR